VNEADELYEMVNIYPADSGLPMTVWAGPRGNARHDVRVKVNMAHGNQMSISNTAVVAVRPVPRLIAGRLSSADLQAVSDWLRLNEAALVAHWDGPDFRCRARPAPAAAAVKRGRPAHKGISTRPREALRIWVPARPRQECRSAKPEQHNRPATANGLALPAGSAPRRNGAAARRFLALGKAAGRARQCALSAGRAISRRDGDQRLGAARPGMAQTAPMPAGFDAPPLDADSLPPVEAEVVPPPAPPAPGAIADREPIRRPLPQSGYLTASPAALRNLAEGEARIRAMIGPGVKHAATLAAEHGIARQRLVDFDGADAATADGDTPQAAARGALPATGAAARMATETRTAERLGSRPRCCRRAGISGTSRRALADHRPAAASWPPAADPASSADRAKPIGRCSTSWTQFEQRIAALETAVRGGREI
jgi:hypothetical protein